MSFEGDDLIGALENHMRRIIVESEPGAHAASDYRPQVESFLRKYVDKRIEEKFKELGREGVLHKH